MGQLKNRAGSLSTKDRPKRIALAEARRLTIGSSRHRKTGTWVRDKSQSPGCPRNCKRRATLQHVPLELSLREGGRAGYDPQSQ
jgi:hypothetical protein